ncbi:class I tRNA ligase family protein, partial [Candidatus Pelagibacter sp.]|nr:class I tRNA ligase family protein [Candidatus Pelagibacter sp.]
NFKNKKIVIAEALLNSVLKDCEIKEFKNLKKFKGKDLKDTICKHPFCDLGYDHDIPMLEARFVTIEQGTGIVHCAPSHGPDDFNLCLNNGIKAIETVDDDGKYTKNVSLFEGLHIFKANPVVIEKLKDQDNLLSNGELVHSYPHSWRSKAPLVHRATPQWFISMESHKLRSKALKAINDTTFYPSKGKERLKSMIETRPDWCVSRQRVWGVPLPIFINKKSNEILIDDEVFENIANIYEKEGSDCWFSDDTSKFLGNKYKAEDFEKLSDIVEVWFDSGSTHSFVLEKRKDLKWPASMYLEGSDQHRGWFHSSLLESCGTRGKAPFESILSHGFVVDGKGLKMSKSLGNVIAPEDILKKYGADILRIWVASSNYAEDLRIDYSILDQHAESYRKIRNTFRYLLGNLNDSFEKQDLESIQIENLPELEQFMLHKIYNLNKNFNSYFNNYDFHNLYKELLNFCTVDLSAFYFDIRKDTLYCDPKESEKRKSTLILLNIILESLLKWFAPILSFTTEEIYQLVVKHKKSIHLEKFLNFPKNFENIKLNAKWQKLIKIRDICNISIEQKRANKEIGSSLEATLLVKLNSENQKILNGIDLSELCITSSVKILNNDDEEIIVETNKASGEKCPICWKIRTSPCERPHCK